MCPDTRNQKRQKPVYRNQKKLMSKQNISIMICMKRTIWPPEKNIGTGKMILEEKMNASNCKKWI